MSLKAVVQRTPQLCCGALRASFSSGCLLESICKVNHRWSYREIHTRDCSREALKWPYSPPNTMTRGVSEQKNHLLPSLLPPSISRFISFFFLHLSPSSPLLSTSLDVFSNKPFSCFSLSLLPSFDCTCSLLSPPLLSSPCIFPFCSPSPPALTPLCPVAEGLTSDC